MPWRVQREADNETISEYLEEGNFDTNNKSFRNLLKDYMMKSRYSYENIGHEGLGIEGYVKISSAARRAMDDLAIYALYDLYINRAMDDLDAKYYYWEREIKYWCDYANNKASDNRQLMLRKTHKNFIAYIVICRYNALGISALFSGSYILNFTKR